MWNSKSRELCLALQVQIEPRVCQVWHVLNVVQGNAAEELPTLPPPSPVGPKLERARHPLQQCRGKETQYQGTGRLRVGGFVFILFKANCAIYKITAEMMHLLQSFSYRWAETQDNHNLFSLVHSTPLGSPAVQQSEQLEHKELCSAHQPSFLQEQGKTSQQQGYI